MEWRDLSFFSSLSFRPKWLIKEEGIFAGTSSCLNVIAALRLARELGPAKTVATVAVDSGLKYLSRDLYTT